MLHKQLIEQKKLSLDSILEEENIQSWENIECIIYCKSSI